MQTDEQVYHTLISRRIRREIERRAKNEKEILRGRRLLAYKRRYRNGAARKHFHHNICHHLRNDNMDSSPVTFGKYVPETWGIPQMNRIVSSTVPWGFIMGPKTERISSHEA